jgi:hypothetical protein
MATVLSKTQNLADSFLACAYMHMPIYIHTHTHTHSLLVCEDSNLLGHDSVHKLLHYNNYGGNKILTNATIPQSIKIHVIEDLTIWH